MDKSCCPGNDLFGCSEDDMMPEESKTNRRPVCGKCRSGPLYKDRDAVSGIEFIACMKCGNRYPGGPAPVLKDGKDKPSSENKIEYQPGRPLVAPKGESMEEKKETQIITGKCKNCKRDGVNIIKSMGICNRCATYAKRTKGEDRRNALAEAAKLYGALKPSERLRYGEAKAKKIGAAYPERRRVRNVVAYEPAAIMTNPVSESETKASKHIARLKIIIFPQDKEVYDFILSSARRDRRTVPKQILYLIDQVRNGRTAIER
jgi:hypothetical protein